MTKKKKNLEDEIIIPNFTVKSSRYQYKDAKAEGKRLLKALRAGFLTKDDLTAHGLELLRRYSGFVPKTLLEQWQDSQK